MTDWRKLFPTAQNQTLEYFPPSVRDGIAVVKPPRDILEEGAEEWQNSLIAQFLDKPPTLNVMQRTISKLWAKKGNTKISIAGENLFVLQLDSDEMCSWVLENGPWHIQQNTMIIRRWTPNAGKLHLDLNKIPLWFHLHHVPLELYNRKGISYIASVIGNPLYMDKITANKSRLAYARVCIEVCAEDDPPDKIDIALDDNNITSIAISIPWKPYVCKTCKTFGHSGLTCSKLKKTEKVWIVKNNEQKVLDEIVDEQKVLDEIVEQSTKKDTTLDTLEDNRMEHKDTNEVYIEPESQMNDHSTPYHQVKNSGSNKQNSNQMNYELLQNSKKQISGSKNKFAILNDESTSAHLEEETEEEIGLEEDMIDDELNEDWKHLVDNAVYSPRKPRAASQGVALVLGGMKKTKAKVAAKGGKKGSGKAGGR